jgi:hypothetical protein
MKNFIYLLLLLIFPSVYAQEEFFGNNNGLSLSYLQGFIEDVDHISGITLNAYFKKGIAAGFGVQHIDNYTYPMAAVAYYIIPKSGLNYPMGSIGLSYANIESTNIVGVNFGLMKCFFPDSHFPFAMNGSFSLQTEIGDEDLTGYTLDQVIGIGYVQAFFANKRLYPFVGISYAFEPYTKINLFTAILGINLKIGTKPGKNKI